MADTTIIKIDSSHSPRGKDGQIYLATGANISMRLWKDEQPDKPRAPIAREYDTVGYVIAGRAELWLEGQTVILAAGDSWIVPRGASHSYRILEGFTAVEATTPPAAVHDRDAPA